MTNSYNQSSRAEEKIVKVLNQLPKQAAPVQFDGKLMHNIQRVERGEAVKILSENHLNWKTASLSIAAGLAIAVLGFGPNNTDAAAVSNSQIAKEAVVDSANKELKQFDKPVNLVNEKKK